MASQNRDKGSIRDISILVGGKAGDGVLFTGNVLARWLKKQGWWAVTYRDFPSNIRGEATQYIIRASLDPIESRRQSVDVLLAFDCEAIQKHSLRLSDGGLVLCDGADAAVLPASVGEHLSSFAFPLRQPARQRFGRDIFKNMIALGALGYLFDLAPSHLEGVIRELYEKRKGEEVVQLNLQAASFGFDQGKRLIPEEERWPLLSLDDGGRLILSGDEAIALGALAAGCRFFAAYPICPASEIWQWMAPRIKSFGGVVVQVEDELAALNMAIGAAYAGARAMTSTSGPGASLMMEAFSLAGMTETPVVIAHVQRVGPSTGLPTKTQQGDILQWVFGSHGEFPRVVLAPGSVEECFTFTVAAFNLAEKLQGPVVILTDLDMGQNLRTTRSFDLSNLSIQRGKLLAAEDVAQLKEFKRYEITEDGISPRVIPGIPGGVHLVESVEHDEFGWRSEDVRVRITMMEKRMRKSRAIVSDLIPSGFYGEPEASVGLISLGSTRGPILEAMNKWRQEGTKIKFLQIRTLWPFPAAEVKNFLAGLKHLFVVENNYSGQLLTLLKSQVELDASLKINGIRKYSPDNFVPEEIYEPVSEAFKK